MERKIEVIHVSMEINADFKTYRKSKIFDASKPQKSPIFVV